MANNNDITLVTGGSGYLGGWAIAQLLSEGHHVRVTLRNLDRVDAVRADIASVVPDTSRLEFVAADLLSNAGWGVAMEGVRQVAHVA
ncbi:NAD-dependent epimerase/dehydratase family protein [Novosphingobium barchaimii]|uniref:NAD-dependent epimerase/dehydratase family protein n=1 Tax=Novosphingobium barchaimii TaxID=1420591 RepID=UPI000741028F|nr:NAD-dependent epimerase/dehydratase family protein [Novosphingobium barchaimii]